MPLETFLKLNAVKKKRVYFAIQNEFLCVPLEKVSVKNIVVEAGIPRGSFYQYFDDKEDALRLVIRTVQQNDEKQLLQNDSVKEYSVFQFICHLYEHERKQLELGDISPKSRLLLQVAKSARATEILLDEISAAVMKTGQYERLWKNAGLQSLSQQDKDIVLSLLFASLKEAMLSSIADTSVLDVVFDQLNKKVMIIESGVKNLMT